MREIGEMTLSEFRLRKQAYKMRMLDKERDQHYQAFLNRAVNATNRNGSKYKYEEFKQFYDFDKRRSEVLGIVDQDPVSKDLIERARRLQKLRKGE